jgi:hypothetical protein
MKKKPSIEKRALTDLPSWKVRERVLLVIKTIMMQNPDVRSRAGIAFRIHATAPAVSRWQSRTAHPTTDNLVDLCEAFSISPSFLFLGVGSMHGDLDVQIRLENLESRVDKLESKAGIKREK